MEQIDLEKLEVAITYMQRIADGKNPVNNMPAEDDDVLNNPNVIRCMFFVKEILEEVKSNGGCIGKKVSRKQREAMKEDFPFEVLSKFEYKEDLPISRFIEQINGMVDLNIYKKLSYKPIMMWLRDNEFIVDEYSNDNKKTGAKPTEKGCDFGIYTVNGTSIYGIVYVSVLFNKNAQEYIVKMLEKIYEC